MLITICMAPRVVKPSNRLCQIHDSHYVAKANQFRNTETGVSPSSEVPLVVMYSVVPDRLIKSPNCMSHHNPTSMDECLQMPQEAQQRLFQAARELTSYRTPGDSNYSYPSLAPNDNHAYNIL